jgi:phosphoglycerol transferase
MAFIVRSIALLAIFSVELGAVYAVLHPHVSPEYKAYYIDKSTVDWRTPHYSATPEEGIAFGREGWPDFVSATSGISQREEWGRWTDASLSPSPSIFFSRTINGPVCLVLMLEPSQAELGKNLQVIWGDESKAITLSEPGFHQYRLQFEGSSPANRLSFRFAAPVPRNRDVLKMSTDGRRLGIGLAWLQIHPGSCPLPLS